MTRVPNPAPTDRSDAQSQLFTAFTSGERARPGTDFSLVDDSGQLGGPPAAWMWSAELGLALASVGAQLRFHLELTPRQREIVILMVAHVEQSPYERYAHAKAAAAAGLSDDEISAIVDTGDWRPREPDERLVVEIVSNLLMRANLPSAVWEPAIELLGGRAVFEIVTLVGWYRMMAMQLRTFELEPPTETVSQPA